jgi:hypothetical protein
MLKIQNLTNLIFILIVLVVLIFANFKNNTIQKIIGYTEIHISQIRVDENVFFGKIFYPSELSQFRNEGDTLSLMEFNNNLRELISDASLFKFFTANLIDALYEDKNIKILKMIDVGNATILHTTGHKDFEGLILPIENEFKKNIYDTINSLVINFDNKISSNDINVATLDIVDVKLKGLLYLISTILITVFLYFAYREVFKIIKSKKE